MSITLNHNRKYLEFGLVGFLLIFYTVGTVGLLREATRDWFLGLSFLNLLLSFGTVILGRRERTAGFFGFLLLCFATGMTVEWIGTKTGLLFGSYHYGENLGPKLWGVPWVIGLNWGILVLTSASIINRFKLSPVISAVLSALLMSLLDVLMEPVAVKSDFWTWENGIIPFYNYICWFGVSLPLQYLYFRSRLVESNKVYETLFLILTVFFTLLNFI